MLFPLRQQILAPVLGVALGGAAVFNITRDFFLDSLIVEVTGVITGSAATAGPDGMLGLVRNLNLSISDGSSNRNQTNVSGVSAVQKGFLATGSIDQGTLNTQLIGMGANATQFILRYPLFFKHPQLSDPVGSAFMLPLPRYNANPTLSVQLATQAQLDQNASPTFAIAAGVNVRVILNKRQVDNIQFPTMETEFIDTNVGYASGGAGTLYELQVPGSYFLFGIRGYLGAVGSSAWADPTTNAGTINAGNVILQLLGNTLRTSRFSDMAYLNQLATQDNWSAVATRNQQFGLFVGLAAYNFLHDGFGLEVGEVGSSLNSNVLAGSGSRVQLLIDLTGGVNASNTYFWDRVFGDLSPLQIQMGSDVG
jgi:hypothetical protein